MDANKTYSALVTTACLVCSAWAIFVMWMASR
jgi:hypothetical protein